MYNIQVRYIFILQGLFFGYYSGLSMVVGRDDFVRVQYAFWVHGAFQAPHQVDDRSALTVLQVFRFRQADPMLGAHAPPVLGRPPVNERLDRPCQLFVGSRSHHVQMQVAVACSAQSITTGVIQDDCKKKIINIGIQFSRTVIAMQSPLWYYDDRIFLNTLFAYFRPPKVTFIVF